MTMRRITLLLVALCPIAAAADPIDPALAGRTFAEVQALVEHDNRWGTPLYGPLLFVDRQTRALVANQADKEGRLRREGAVFVGALPEEVNIANTATTWAGVKWTMVAWPLPADRQPRARLIVHELFHRIQDTIGLPATAPANRHLDGQHGRTWLRLEWRALERALAERGAARKRAVADALYFRRHRRAPVPAAAAEEGALETNEGLAEYTGLALSARSPGEYAVLAWYGLRQAQREKTFMRSFAYASGPAYAGLLDAATPRWHKSIRAGDDLGDRLGKALAIELGPDSEAEATARARRYDGDEVMAAEAKLETMRRERTARFRARFIDGPVLVLPLSDDVHYSFDPNDVMALDEAGTIYPTLRVSDGWGILEVTDGALLVTDGGRPTEARVPAPADVRGPSLAGPGWTAELRPGWKIEAGPRRGDYRLRSP